MLDDFVIRAGLAGAGVALAAGPLGAFVIWRRMAYFGDATGHAALLGVALGLATGLPVVAGALVVALLMGIAVTRLARTGRTVDATLGVLSHSALAVGLVAIALAPSVRTDPSAWLFGDILAVGWGDVAAIWGGAAVVALLLAARWNRLLAVTLNPELARAAGIRPEREDLWLTTALALAVAMALQVVGALLAAALLVIPAAAARGPARSPEGMAALAAGSGVLAVAGGLALSLRWDTPAGPSIVVAAAAIYVAALIWAWAR